MHLPCGGDFRLQFKGLTFMIPGCKLLQSSACAKKFISGCLNFHKAVCFSLGVIRSLRPSEDWPDLQGLKTSKTHSLSFPQCRLTCCAWGRACNLSRVQADQRPPLLLLKPVQDFFHLNFPNRGQKEAGDGGDNNPGPLICVLLTG